MKWIGQHIVDFIARFRSDVYMEDISEGTVDGDLFLGLDSNGKVVKEDIRAVSGVGDITRVTITTDSGGGSAASDTEGSADFSILGTAGVGVTNSGATITVTAVPGEIFTIQDGELSQNNFTDADHTKLNGIETSATADQTNAEIRAALEAATDANVFTDAENTKLAGIEASATADQTNAEIRTAVEAASDSNVFTDADHTKLNGIEASADVTDTANVTSAGALMDSEVDADIKTLSLPASTTISTYGASLVDDADAEAARTTLGLGTSAVLDTAVIANGGAGVATADQIHTFVTTQTDAMDADTAGNAATATLAADATTLATPRAIFGHNFDGSAALTGVIASAYLDADTAHLSVDQEITSKTQINKRQFSNVGASTGDCEGDIIYLGADAASHVAGNIYTLNDSNQWVITDADATATSIGLLAIAMGDEVADGMCIRGMANLNTTFAGSPDPGAILYLDGATPGAATGTVPTGNGDTVRVLGYKIGSGTRMWFNPDNTFVEVSA
mgnify:CR=1 FL=1